MEESPLAQTWELAVCAKKVLGKEGLLYHEREIGEQEALVF